MPEQATSTIGKILAFIGSIIHYIVLKVSTVIQDRLYTNKILFNTCWEDPRLDTEAFDLGEEDKIVMITSAGCNALAYLLDNPGHIYCIDRNPCQNSILDLKIAAIKTLSYEDFWQLFGLGFYPNFTKELYPKLRPLLSKDSQVHWDKHSYYFDAKGWRKSFYYHGSCGGIAYILHLYMKMYPGLLADCQKLFDETDLKEQKKTYYRDVHNKLWNPVVKAFVRSSWSMACCGIPVEQQKLLAGEAGDFSKIGIWIMEQLEYCWSELPIHENYFWRVYIKGRYSKTCCPDYLKEENFQTLKERVDRISMHTTTIAEFLREHKTADISRFVLLDHQDWMATKPEILEDEWQAILDTSAPNTRYFWRSASPDTQFIYDTEVKYQGKRRTIESLVDRKTELAERLHPLDRVHTYTSFHIAHLKSE
mmetsp:Transcript_29410/g.32696  ORF Transcript_29410/g.32696 Transcript_29410/m.32696 type:complete len:421 (+) Transcript_29410:968-2230(+)|eukprot:CAMPEP_0168526112 /NCGR_PEP_ID=MMETSP0405-20121227/11751_1 /TAXON_ID=498012 /ORGANISM="Trichosphaerium sp, Strain Am-I-7 wt" /LENGTH=420 /DNA_ID=CAMNT_0008548847 /DNA_START=638 /DNA_END=1900 /DNA_ORIENTATION=-